MSAAEKIEQREEMLEVATLVAFTQNPRRPHEDDPDVIELAADMERRGQDTAIIVRSIDDGESWEVLAGNRRWAAARRNGWETIRAIIRRDLADDDAGAHELCLAENLQHKDLAPLEEADGLAELHRKMGPRTTVAQLASAVGKSESYVRERLVLCGVVDEVRAMAAKIDVGALHAIASTSPVVQGRVAKRFATLLEHQPRITRGDVARIMKTENVTRSLKVVSWDLGDAELVPEVGACNTCKKRTGQGALVDDVVDEGDVCLDDECYSDKGAASWERIAKEERAQGTKVLSEKESARIVQYGRPIYGSDYVAVEDKVATVSGYKKVTALVNAGDVARVVAQDPETKAPVHMFLKKDVDAAVKRFEAAEKAKAKAEEKKSAAAKKVDTKLEAARQRARDAQELRDEIDELVLRHAAAEVSSGRVKPEAVLLRVVALICLPSHCDGQDLDVAMRRGLIDRKSISASGAPALEKLAKGYAKQGSVVDLLALVYELLVGGALRNAYDLESWFGIERGDFEKDAMKRIAERKLEAAAGAEKGKGGKAKARK